MLYSKWSWKVFWIILKYGKGAFWDADRLISTYSEAQSGCPVTYYYSFDEVRRLFQEDFDIIELRKEHIFPYKIGDYIRYRYRKVWYFRYLPRYVFRWLERHFGWHTLIVAKPKEKKNEDAG